LFIREHRLAALSVVVLGVGVGLTGLFPSMAGVVGCTVLMSFGFHYYETMNQSLTLQYFGPREAPLVMARMRSAGALANIAIGAVIWVLALWLDYPAMFSLLGVVAVAAGTWAFTRDPSRSDVPPQLKKLVFRRRYWLYYVLTFLAGARRQIFTAFAVFLLVEHYHYTVQGITALFVVNNVINVFVNPAIGRAVNRFGERFVLSLEYAGLVAVFLAYALVNDPWVAAGLYVADNVLFNFTMAIRTYYQKIADPGDIASGMAVGFTVNHVAAVLLPVLGGLIWLVDWKIVFVGGAALSLASLVMTQCIRLPRPAPRA
ncbi:MAG: MFS transporter, partial [Desulfovibrionaceae bacterium]